MIIVKLIGGLGNQLFQYALGRNLAHINQTELKLDITGFETYKLHSYGLQNFNIIENFATNEEIVKFQKKGWRKILENFKPHYKKTTIKHYRYDFNPNILKLKDNTYIDGYWQNEKYFLDIVDIIKTEFTLKNPLSKEAQALLKKIKECNSVSLHIRRGDYTTNQKFSKIYKILGTNYYFESIKKIIKWKKDPFFYIFTDDAEWVSKNISLPYQNVLINQFKLKDYEELILMSNCRHNIIANSTFSWWGAWLNQNPDKIVIVPKNWFKIQSYNEKYELPKSWCILENN